MVIMAQSVSEFVVVSVLEIGFLVGATARLILDCLQQ